MGLEGQLSCLSAPGLCRSAAEQACAQDQTCPLPDTAEHADVVSVRSFQRLVEELCNGHDCLAHCHARCLAGRPLQIGA